MFNIEHYLVVWRLAVNTFFKNYAARCVGI